MVWPAAQANNKREKSERDGIIIKDACPSRLLPPAPVSYPSTALIEYIGISTIELSAGNGKTHTQGGRFCWSREVLILTAYK